MTIFSLRIMQVAIIRDYTCVEGRTPYRDSLDRRTWQPIRATALFFHRQLLVRYWSIMQPYLADISVYYGDNDCDFIFSVPAMLRNKVHIYFQGPQLHAQLHLRR